jgi:hypothetical protein
MSMDKGGMKINIFIRHIDGSNILDLTFEGGAFYF